MTIPTLTTLPVAPARTDPPATFVTRADAFLAAIVTFQGEMNTSIGAMNTDIAGVNTNVLLAEDWATKNDAAVSGTDWSAFANASGAAPTGSAKAWATTANGVVVADGEYSAKSYAVDSSSSASASSSSASSASTSETNAQIYAAAAQAAVGVPSLSGNAGKALSVNTAEDGVEWADVDSDPTLGTLTKTFTTGEVSTINLTSSVLAPVVSVTKEVPQSGVTNNTWDVNSTTENYTRLNSAPATTLDWGVDLANASYVSGFNIGSQETVAQGLAFSSDGTKMYIVGLGVDTVFQYSLSTAFDVSTASYNAVSFSVASQETTPLGLDFSADGTKMYVVGYTNSIVYQYSLSTAWDLSTASYSSISFDLNSQETQAIFVSITSNGTKMYIRGFDNGNVFYQYTLSTAYDVSTASYDSISFNPSANATDPKSLSFSTNGTLLYIMGGGSDAVYQYSLSTAFNISTATYDSISFSVASQDNQPADLAVIGSKLYFIGGQNTSVYQYSLPAGNLALGTGSFASADVGKTIEANSGVFVLTATDGSFVETTAPTSYAQVASGSWEMYGVVYNAADGDLQLSGGVFNTFDVSTASYSQSFSVSAQENSPQGIEFNTDGTKMFVIGTTGDDVNEYALSTGFDVSTASFTDSFSIASQDGVPYDLAFNTDGTKMFILGEQTGYVYQYTLSTGFDVSTASYDSVSFNFGPQESAPHGLTFNTDGTKMFIVGSSGDDVNEYALSTGFNVSTASFTDAFSVGTQDTNPRDIAFNTDGTKMFVVGQTGQDVNEYALTTGFDVSTASYSQNFSIGTEDTQPNGIAFNTDGTKMFIVGATGDNVYEYSIGTTAIPTGYQPVHTTASTDTTYWTDINSMTADQAAGDGNVYYAISTDDRTTWTVIDNTDGERDIVRNNGGTWQYNSNGTYASETWTNGTTNTELATLAEAMEGAVGGYGLSNASYDSKSFNTSSQDTNTTGVAFNITGTKMFTVGSTGNDVNEYNLSTAFDISTATYSQNFSLSAQDTNIANITFNNDGTKMFITGGANDSVYEYALSTGFDVSTAAYTTAFSVASQDNTVQGISFNSDGTKMFVVGLQNDSVYEYSLSTGFDISTSSYVQSFSVASEETAPRGLDFNASGTKMFVTGMTGDDVNEYILSTAFDISTSSFSQKFSVASQATAPTGLCFSQDGTKMFIVNGDAVIYQYSTSSYTNQMDKTQLDAVTDPNHIALGDDLDLSIIFNMTSGTTVPSSDGVAINYDANILNQGAVLGTDYNFDAPAGNKVRITAVNAANYKVRVV